MLLSPAFVAGAASYMSLPFEPGVWPSLALFFAVTTAVVLLWRWSALRAPLGIAMAAAIGFVVALGQAHLVDAPRLGREGAGALSGEIAWFDERDGRMRLTLANARFVRFDEATTFERVRVSLRLDGPPSIGDLVEGRVVLRPPPPPAAPGGYDFRRKAYFEGLGAVGFSIGDAKTTFGSGGSWFDRARLYLRAAIQDAMADRPATAAVIVALMVGDRSWIQSADNDALRASGLAHLLAISGLHLGMVAGGVYLFVRLLLAAPHGVALRLPAHKLAAVVAILAAAAYLGLSGGAPPAQRAFVMVLAAMLAILIDRLRSGLWFVAWAAVAVAAISPHVIVSPSFQLSFAAATGIVAAYEVLSARRRRMDEPAFQGLGRLRPVAVYVIGVAGASLIATIATAPLALAHFQQAPLFGVVANLLAMPAMAFVVMPFAVVAGLLAPIGLADFPLWVMGQGIEFILAVAHMVAGWPGGVVRVAATGDWVPFAFMAGGALFVILRGWPRYLALVGPAAAVIGLATAAPPDLLVSDDGRLAAVVEDETLYVSSLRRGRFEREVWARYAGVAETRSLSEAPWAHCDDLGCVVERRGQTVAVSWAPSAMHDDCERADIVIVMHDGRAPCAADTVIDAFDLRRDGAHALRFDRDGVLIERTLDPSGERLWTRPPASSDGSGQRGAPGR